ncbi:hypothetical protein [Halalkalibacter oceani]|uniref:hypothetical protein n=1 Tax=Halalkalibacter oceani TaxID=1653776 RepID=UPI003D81C207
MYHSKSWDVIAETDKAEKGTSYTPHLGSKVITYAKQLLDHVLPLATGSHQERWSAMLF